MAGVIPYLPVTGPTMVAPRGGLWDAVEIEDLPHGPWEEGVVYDSSGHCTDGGLWQMCCSEFFVPQTPEVVSVSVVFTAAPAPGGAETIISAAATAIPSRVIELTVGSGDSATHVQIMTGAASAPILRASCNSTLSMIVIGPNGEIGRGDLVISPVAACAGTVTVTMDVTFHPGEKKFSGSRLLYSDPFVIYDGRECPNANMTPAQAVAQARQRLEVSAERQMETALWEGPTSPHLAGPDTVVIPGGPMSPSMAVAALENHAANHYQGRPLIHAPRTTAGLFHREMQLVYDWAERPETNTPVGSRWVFGRGFTGTGPADQVPPTGRAWIYATGAIKILRSPVESKVSQSRSGCVTGLAEQVALFMIDCGYVAAVEVDFSRCDCPVPTP